MSALGVEAVVLRAAVGNDNFGEVEKLLAIFDGLERRGLISKEGATAVLDTLAEELVTRRIAVECANDLSALGELPDTHTPEDPHE